MVNNRVEDRHALLKASREEPDRVRVKVEESDCRKLAPDGSKLELQELPPAAGKP